MNFITATTMKTTNETPFEMVERKGVGHPDTLADGIAEKISIEYSKYCLKHFGAVLHHNLDKVSVIGGLVDINFGKGKMLRPARLVINGRMSADFAGQKIDIEHLQTTAAKNYVAKALPHMDVERWLEILSLTNSYSHNPLWYHPRGLNDLPDAKRPYANDTSTCVGYWPLSMLERVVLALEGYFYKEDGAPKLDYIGQDIKLMAVRSTSNIDVTMCVPLISTRTPNVAFYKSSLANIRSSLLDVAYEVAGPAYRINIHINTADDDDKRNYYTLLTGSCLEAGEEGVVGRGNRYQGTVSSTRPYSMEAPNGKNPVYFVGKVHTLVADEIAKNVGQTFGCECNIFISTRNGEDLFDPSTVIVETNKEAPHQKVRDVVEKIFAKRDWTDRIINEELFLPRPGNYYLSQWKT